MTHCETFNSTDDELMHYGVKGMKWGVRRAQKRLSKASTKEAHDKAISTLNKHRQKGTKKLKKLSAEADNLNKKRSKQIEKGEVEAAKLRNKALKKKVKANKWYVSDEKAMELRIKADEMETKAESIKAKSELTKAKIEQNRVMSEAFQEQIDLIDATIVSEGKSYLRAS